jgi:uncharacterized membrane protein YfcA
VFLGVAGFAVFFVALAKAGFGGMIASLAMPLGMFIGKRINQRIPKDPFYMFIHVLLVILGVYLVVNAFAQMGAA